MLEARMVGTMIGWALRGVANALIAVVWRTLREASDWDRMVVALLRGDPDPRSARRHDEDPLGSAMLLLTISVMIVTLAAILGR
jgi:hypothetical protein